VTLARGEGFVWAADHVSQLKVFVFNRSGLPLHESVSHELIESGLCRVHDSRSSRRDPVGDVGRREQPVLGSA
jgi:hypothetical protein